MRGDEVTVETKAVKYNNIIPTTSQAHIAESPTDSVNELNQNVTQTDKKLHVPVTNMNDDSGDQIVPVAVSLNNDLDDIDITLNGQKNSQTRTSNDKAKPRMDDIDNSSSSQCHLRQYMSYDECWHHVTCPITCQDGRDCTFPYCDSTGQCQCREGIFVVVLVTVVVVTIDFVTADSVVVVVVVIVVVVVVVDKVKLTRNNDVRTK